MRLFILAVACGALQACCAPPIQRVVHVTTYRDGQTDIVRHDLLYRGKLEKDTVAKVLKQYGMAEDATVLTKENP